MSRDQAERLIEAVEKVGSALGWIVLGLAIIALNTCALGRIKS